jgi:anti-sigma factor RsiW
MIDDQDQQNRASAAIAPVTEADLHAYADRQLNPVRHAEVAQFRDTHPEERARVEMWQRHNALLSALLDPVLDEPVPLRLPTRPVATAWPWRGVAASLAIALVSAGTAWTVRGRMDTHSLQVADTAVPVATMAADTHGLEGFARRAAVAYVVYSPDARRPVEIGADQEQALVTWLTKRMGADIHPPALGPLGYELIGGRLLPGESGPVAQFMYQSSDKKRLTLYVTRDVTNQDASFKFGREGQVNVFYWVDDHFGYAISAGADRATLLKVSEEVYRQLQAGARQPNT